MSANDERASEETSGRPESVSVYDLIYRDATRIALILSQFDRRGLMTSLKHTESVADTRAAKNQGSARGGPRVFNAGVGFEEQEGEEAREATERGYDPQWRNALVLLDYLTQNDMIAYDLAEAELGQFVLVSGSLNILDLRVMKSLWDMPSIQALLTGGGAGAAAGQTRQQQRQAERRGSPPGRTASGGTQLRPDTFALDMLKALPHSLQARISGPDGEAWCSLDESSLVVSSSDLLLKHGVDIAGGWSVMGILDARPNNAPHMMDAPAPLDFSDGPEGAIGRMLSVVAPGCGSDRPRDLGPPIQRLRHHTACYPSRSKGTVITR